MPGSLGQVSAISAGGDHTCAMQSSTDLAVCWGWDVLYQSTVPGSLGQVSAITAGSLHTCAIQIGTDLAVCWGYDNWNQSTVPEDLGNISAIAAGNDYTCAIQAGPASPSEVLATTPTATAITQTTPTQSIWLCTNDCEQPYTNLATIASTLPCAELVIDECTPIIWGGFNLSDWVNTPNDIYWKAYNDDNHVMVEAFSDATCTVNDRAAEIPIWPTETTTAQWDPDVIAPYNIVSKCILS